MTERAPHSQVFPVLGIAAALLARKQLPEDPLLARKALDGLVEPEVARAAIELAGLRRRAGSKFRDPEGAWLTRKGLEQATRLPVAEARARELARLAPGARVWDRTAGLGADALAIGRAGLGVVASELDPVQAGCCRENLRAAGLEGAEVLVGDAREHAVTCDLVLLDPDRRPAAGTGQGGAPGGGRRRLDPGAFAPAVEDWPALLGAGHGGCVKLPPGLAPEALEARLGPWLAATPHRWTWVESGGDLCELGLWTGDLAPAGEPVRAAWRVEPDGRAAHLAAPTSGAASPASSPDPDRVTLLAEVRPAARRAGLAHAAARSAGLDLGALDPEDPEVGYLATDAPGLGDPDGSRADPVGAAFLDRFRVLEAAPLDPKRVRKLLRERGIGPLTIKKRGVPGSADELARRLGGKTGDPGLRPGLLILSRTPAGRRAYLVERVS